MINKEQIIIDGVNVSGCEYLECGMCNAERVKRDYQELEQRHNEVFQEFERLKIECEELKDFARREGNQREIYYKEFLRTNSVLEEIEEIVNVDFSLPCARTDCTYPKPCKDSLTENGTKCMRFALQEIKDIVQKNKEK